MCLTHTVCLGHRGGVLVGIAGSFLPEAADVAVKALRVGGESQVEFNAGLRVNALMNA